MQNKVIYEDLILEYLWPSGVQGEGLVKFIKFGNNADIVLIQDTKIDDVGEFSWYHLLLLAS